MATTGAHDRSYDGDLAHARFRERLRRPRPGRLLVDSELRRQVEAKLEQEWSPEQIMNWLRAAFPDRLNWHVCHETIYQAIYVASRGGLRRQLTQRLRTGRPLRERRRRAAERRTRFVTPGRLIDQRPEIVLLRQRIGDWEGDLIVGRSNRSRSRRWSIGAAATCIWCTCPTAMTPPRSAKPSSPPSPSCHLQPGTR